MAFKNQAEIIQLVFEELRSIEAQALTKYQTSITNDMKSAGLTVQLSEVIIFHTQMDMELGNDGDTESIAAERCQIRKRASQNPVKLNNENPDEETVQSRKSKRKERKSQRPEKLSKPRNSIEPDALIIRRKVKERSIQKYFPVSRLPCPADRPTLTASLILAAAITQKVVREDGKIRIGWVNCRISTTKAVTWSCGKLPFQSAINNGSAGFVAATVDSIRLYSCYAPSSLCIVEFTDFLDQLTEDANQHYPVVIAG
ncbi:hypothetical protein EVAR_66289_1 [Eumeta japonica]|uniref:Uncharacterized protein n=1 Tax=Eumeta variegata TaxID=151549 RepID=A0A4C1YQ29_EUMVA|nr:hypothetical protein EVAR_66289_1 [Eumeta japonica]